MRQANREVKDEKEIIYIIRSCDVCRLALNDDGYPYIIPLNFGLKVENGKILLIFHSALEGKKMDLIQKDNRASFEMDCNHALQYFEEKGYCTMAYESVIGRSRIRILSEEEKFDALQEIMNQYHGDEKAYFNPAAISRTSVYCLEVEEIQEKEKIPNSILVCS